jgi:hypothetical protein
VNGKLRGIWKETVLFVYFDVPADEARILDQDQSFEERDSRVGASA